MELIKRLREDFSDIQFVKGEENLWFPEEKEIIFCPGDNIGILHELGHALCDHSGFSQDIELIHAERDAWDKAIELGKIYHVDISDERIESTLDWYRDWLHKRSTCPNCNQNGAQNQENGNYFCFNCNTSWKTNDARKVALRRYKNTP